MRAVAPVAIMSHNIVPPSLPSCSNNDRWPTPIKLFRQHLDNSLITDPVKAHDQPMASEGAVVETKSCGEADKALSVDLSYYQTPRGIHHPSKSLWQTKIWPFSYLSWGNPGSFRLLYSELWSIKNYAECIVSTAKRWNYAKVLLHTQFPWDHMLKVNVWRSHYARRSGFHCSARRHSKWTETITK